MNKNEQVVKINFFKKIWYSITQFEKYPLMATEGLGKAIKYLIKLTAIVSIFIMIGSLLQMKNLVDELAKYIDEEIPEFSCLDGNLSMESKDTIVIEDVQYDIVDKIVINTLTETQEQKNEMEKNNLTVGTTVFLFKDEIILNIKTENDESVRQVFTYNDFVTSYTGQYIEKFDKTDFVQYLKSNKMLNFYASYGITVFISLLILNIIVALLDSLEIAILGWITTTIARIRINFVAIYNMAVYSLTLSMILNILYIVMNYFTDFTITYFQVAYITIAYIYLAATIFILKDDLIKKMQEVEKIKQEQLKVREEIKEEQEKKEENKEEKKEEDDKGEEPQGSET
ncbi:MAG: DUF1189 domain-containing protein [Clostridia bacterium]|nr:DUF1189 domain-containing protein [Clostridia bacterium]